MKSGPLSLLISFWLLGFFTCQCFPFDKPGNGSSTLRATTFSTTPSLDACILKRCRRLPDALIIGVKKAGTRALLEFIRLHPDVKAAGKEIHFFDRDFHYGTQYYISEMPMAKREHVVIEKTPAYFTDTVAADRIMQVLGKGVKLIVIVRNPVDRLLSDYAQALFKAKKINSSMASRSFHDVAFHPVDGKLQVRTSYPGLRPGFYAKHLQRFIRTGFNLSNNFIFIDGDKMPKNPGPEIKRLEKFLRLRPLLTESNFYIDKSKGFACVTDPVVFSDGTKSEGGLGKKHRHRRCLGPSKGGRVKEHPKLTRQERELLVKFYAPLNKEFFDLVGEKFPNWQCYDDENGKSVCL